MNKTGFTNSSGKKNGAQKSLDEKFSLEKLELEYVTTLESIITSLCEFITEGTNLS